jgi:8-oxo-dGTP diphosphatase
MPFTYDYPRPMCCVDAVIFKKENALWQVLLIRRGNDPFKGMWALPGGFIEMEETLDQSIAREVQEETGLTGVRLHQLNTYGDPGRDPRGRTISVVFWGILEGTAGVKAGDDARQAKWFDVKIIPPLAFDHNKIVQKALEQVRD